MNVTHLKEKTLVKEFSIETKEGSKKLSVYKGNIIEDDGDLIVITIYEEESNRGEIYKSLLKNKEVGDGYSPERKVVADGDNGWTGVSSSLDGTRQLVYIHSTKREGEFLTGESIGSMLKITFATLTTLIYEGHDIKHVALPVLFRKGISEADYTNFIHLYLYEASQFLRKNKVIKSLKIYIWQEEDASIWNNVLNKKMIISTEKEISSERFEQLKKNTEMQLRSPFYKQLLPPWIQKNVQRELVGKETDLLKLVSEVDKIINYLTNEFCKLPGFPNEMKQLGPIKRIRIMKSQRLIIEWLADYMLSIKVFRNFVNNYSPSKEDEYQYLLQVLQVLDYCSCIFSREGNKTYEKK